MFEGTRDIANAEARPIEVYFEPWGMMHPLAPGASFRVSAASEVEGALEVVAEPGRVAVYAWPGCTIRVHRDGGLVEDFSIPVPGLPPGMSSRGFVDMMFGGPGEPPHELLTWQSG